MRRMATTTMVLALSLAACQSTPRAVSNPPERNGSSPELAVDLSGSRTESEGIQAEKAWLEQHYPGARVKSQALLLGPPVMDMLTITLPSGEEREIYFDISSYFGKW